MRTIRLLTITLISTNLMCTEITKTPSPGGDTSRQETKEEFITLFDGKTLSGWQGDTQGYTVEDGMLICKKKGGGNLFTDKEYSDFILRLEYKLEPGGNNGVGIRAKLEGTPGFTGMEIQVLDDSFPKYQNLKPVQFNGSIYGAVAAKPGHMKQVGEWNAMEIMAKGTHIKVTLNGTVIVDVNTKTFGPKEIHGFKLEGLQRQKGYIAFCGHGHRVYFRNIRLKNL
ncbi:MAG: DUF1080 domain-containing protein [Planctomycetota bacterium]|nr:MAG: DUF1080 domain-containing protein [Planctomycetota bacterium]